MLSRVQSSSVAFDVQGLSAAALSLLCCFFCFPRFLLAAVLLSTGHLVLVTVVTIQAVHLYFVPDFYLMKNVLRHVGKKGSLDIPTLTRSI